MEGMRRSPTVMLARFQTLLPGGLRPALRRRIAGFDAPLVRGMLVLIPVGALAVLIAILDEPGAQTEDTAEAIVATTAATAAPPENDIVAPDSPRIRAMLEAHDDRQVLLFGRSQPGSEFVVYANNIECARDTVDEAGWWAVAVADTAACAPSAGQLLWIARDGAFLDRAQVWSPGSRSVGDGIDESAPPGLAQQGAAPPLSLPTN